MNIWVSSRTKTEDYTWRKCVGCGASTPPTSVSDGFDQWKFEDCIPWYGLVSQGGTSILYFGNLKTDREDSRTRPIFVHAALVATENDERRELLKIVASLLRENEQLARWSAYLLSNFDGENVKPRPIVANFDVAESASGEIGRFAYPREDMAARRHVASKLSTVDLAHPLAVGTTGRSANGIFERVCNSESRWQAAFFSGMCAVKSELVPKESHSDFSNASPRDRLTRRKIAVGIAAAGVVGLLAIVGSCGKKKPESPPELPGPSGMLSQRSQNRTTSAKPYANLPTGEQNSCKTNSPPSSNEVNTVKKHGHLAR